MTKEINELKQVKPTFFSGEIYESDFDTTYNHCKNIAERIESCNKFNAIREQEWRNKERLKQKREITNK